MKPRLELLRKLLKEDGSIWISIDDEGHSYCIKTPSGRECYLPEGRQWALAYETYLKLRKDNRLWFGKNGNNVPALKTFLSEVQAGMVPKTIWFRNEVGDNQDAKKENRALELDTTFETSKPEKLIERILTLGTNEGDLVLDSFLGSGTTAAVAQKMGRQSSRNCHSCKHAEGRVGCK